MDWNPLAPDALGPELMSRAAPGGSPMQFIGSGSVGIAQRFQSTVTQTIAELRAIAQGTSPYPNRSYMFCEVLAAGQEIPTNKATTIFRPNGSAQSGTTWTNQVGSTTGANLYQSVDEAILDTSDYILTQNNDYGPQGTVSFEFATAGALTGKRIIAMRLHIVGSDGPASTAGASSIFIGTYSGGNFYANKAMRNLFPPATGETYFDFGELHLPTSSTWTLADLQALDTSSMRLFLQPNNPFPDPALNSTFRIYQLWLEVDHCDENRLARDTIYRFEQDQPVWTEGVLGAGNINPLGTATWAKVNGTDYTMLLRQMRPGMQLLTAERQRAFIPYLPTVGDSVPGPVSGGSVEVFPNVVLNQDGTVLSLGDAVRDRIYPMLPIVSGGASSVDGIPYATSRVEKIIGSSGNWQQEISGASAQAYGGIYLPLAIDETDGTVADLTVQLRRRSDNVVMGTTVITRAEFLASPLEPVNQYWRIVQAPFVAPATLAAATQYYVNFDEAASDGAWQVQLLAPIASTSYVGEAAYVPTGVPSYVGTTDVATMDGSDLTNGDISLIVYASVDVPADVLAETITIPVEMPAECYPPADCGPAGIVGIMVSWTPVDPGVFAYYEIQRMDDVTDWMTVKTIDSISTDNWVDWEPRLNKESCYRVRQVSEAGPVSDWSATVCQDAPMGGIGYTFTSNVLGTLFYGSFVAYMDRYTSQAQPRHYEFPEASEVIERKIYGRDFVTTYRPTERRGVRFVRSLNINQYATPAVPGVAAFDALRDLVHDENAPYICVRDENGDRWFATVTVPDGDVLQPGEFYYATITVVETTRTPA
jgi:hypothetical protein